MASGSIRGITIEIEGKTSGLVKSLDAVNKDLRTTQSNLKMVEKALKLDPKNIDTLKQKQGLLNTAIEQTKEKLELEKQAAEDAAKALAEGTITQGQYDALQAEVAKTTAELKKLEDEAGNVASSIKDSSSSMSKAIESVGESIKSAGSKMKDFGNNVSNLGKDVSVVSASVAAFGKKSVDAFNEVDAGLDIIVKKTGASGEALKQMEDIALDLATQIPTSFEAAGSAVGEVNTRFGLTGDALEDLSGKFLKFADLNDTDVSGSIDNVQKLLTSYGLSVDQAGAMLDKLNATGQATGISVDTLAKSMITNSAALQEMGLNAYKSADFLGQLEMSGADSSQVLAGLSKALKNATKDGKSINEALAEVQSSMLNAKSDTEGLQVAYELFGTKAGPAIYEACKNGSISFTDLGKAATTSAGSVEKTFETTIDGSDEMTMAMNATKEASAELGKAISSTVAPIIQDLAGEIKNLGDWFKNLNPQQQETIVKVGMLVAALGPLLVIGGKVISTIGTIISVIGSLVSLIATTLVPLISSVSTFITGTLIPAIAAIGAPIIAAIAAITAIIVIIKNWQSVVELFQIIWQGFKEFIVTAANFIKEGVVGAFNFLSSSISSIFSGISSTAQSIWSSIKEGITEKVTNIKNKVSETFSNIKQSVSEKIGNIKDSIIEGFQNAVDFITGLPSQAITWGKDLIDGFVEGIKSKISAVVDAVKSVADKVTSWLHFSRPDEGPLRDYEKWMPDMMEGLAKGITSNIDVLDRALSQVSTNMSMNLMQTDYSPALAGIQSSISGLSFSTGDTIIPISIGNERLDTLVVKANDKFNYRSGGR